MSEREQFEAYWCRDVPEMYNSDALAAIKAERQGDIYKREEIQWAWDAWQAARATPAECQVDKFSSRVCEKGTKSCVVEHSATPADPFPYQKTFDAIAAATSVSGGYVAISVAKFIEAFGAMPADHSPIGWEYYEEGKLIKTYDSVERADHAKKMFGGVVRPIFAPADQEPIYQAMATDDDPNNIHLWMDVDFQGFESMKKRLDVRTRIVYAQPPQNAADHIEAQSKQVAAGGVSFHRGVIVKSLLDEAFQILRPNSPEDCPEEPHMRVALGKKCWEILDRQAPQSDAQSVRDAVIEECAMVCEDSSMEAIAESYERYARYSKECADRLRALKSEPPQKP